MTLSAFYLQFGKEIFYVIATLQEDVTGEGLTRSEKSKRQKVA